MPMSDSEKYVSCFVTEPNQFSDYYEQKKKINAYFLSVAEIILYVLD
jgi:hypothetical protein